MKRQDGSPAVRSDGSPAVRSDGSPAVRSDGWAKVTGKADYTADVVFKNMAYAAIVQATIARGRIEAISTENASGVPGVIAIFTKANLPRLRKASSFPLGSAAERFLPLQDDKIRYHGQAIALVVAENFETARYAASLVAATYTDVASPEADIRDGKLEPTKRAGVLGFMLSEDVKRGDPDKALHNAPLSLDVQYETPREIQMAMEPHATVAFWETEDRLTVREGSQWVDGAQNVLAEWFGIKRENVRLLSAFVGGAFGSRVNLYPHVALTAAAARELRRPVKLVLTRHQVSSMVGNRPATRQRIRLAATPDGRLQALTHDTVNECSRDHLATEPGSRASRSAYATPSYRAKHFLKRLDIVPPTWMRAPGEAPGSFAIECAMDELAVLAKLDPLELRLRNYAEKDPHSGNPWSTHRLREAYAAGSKAIDWSRRSNETRQQREGREWIGLGMARAGYPSRQAPSEARLRLTADERVTLESRGVDIGTGAYTALGNVVAEALNIPSSQVEIRLGSTDYARAAFAGGSMMTASIGTAVVAAADKLMKKLESLGRKPGMTFAQVLQSAGLTELEVEASTYPTLLGRLLGSKAHTSPAGVNTPDAGGTSTHSCGAQFAEVAVDEGLGRIRVRRMVGAFDCGRIINPLTARSQLMGGMVMGLGMALSENALIDVRTGRTLNGNFGDYLVPVNADVPDMEVIFTGEFDAAGGPLGGKAVGEIGITGAAAAIANAVYNATGKRLRRLPLDLRGEMALANSTEIGSS